MDFTLISGTQALSVITLGAFGAYGVFDRSKDWNLMGAVSLLVCGAILMA
jgi:uncharacterized membrane protein YdcZ (DUF606 family)